MPNFLAIIYDPSAERPSTGLLKQQQSALERNMYVYPRSIQLPPQEDPNAATIPADSRFTANAVLKPMLFKSVNLRPGSNLDVDNDLWQVAVTLPAVQDLVNKGAITVIQPDSKLAKNYSDVTIGYKLYSTKDALQLIESSYDLDLLEIWSEGEERPEVVKAIAQQYEAIQRHLRMMAEGSYA
ncbi:MAG TPA: hypothetical protein V6D14_24225 [Coleofasciculaceae cyanobacterium]|jgi:hypothetical protein